MVDSAKTMERKEKTSSLMVVKVMGQKAVPSKPPALNIRF